MPPLWKKAFYPTTASCAGKIDWSQINPNSELYFFPSLFMSLLHEILFRITVSLSLKTKTHPLRARLCFQGKDFIRNAAVAAGLSE